MPREGVIYGGNGYKNYFRKQRSEQKSLFLRNEEIKSSNPSGLANLDKQKAKWPLRNCKLS